MRKGSNIVVIHKYFLSVEGCFEIQFIIAVMCFHTCNSVHLVWKRSHPKPSTMEKNLIFNKNLWGKKPLCHSLPFSLCYCAPAFPAHVTIILLMTDESNYHLYEILSYKYQYVHCGHGAYRLMMGTF